MNRIVFITTALVLALVSFRNTELSAKERTFAVSIVSDSTQKSTSGTTTTGTHQFSVQYPLQMNTHVVIISDSTKKSTSGTTTTGTHQFSVQYPLQMNTHVVAISDSTRKSTGATVTSGTLNISLSSRLHLKVSDGAIFAQQNGLLHRLNNYCIADSKQKLFSRRQNSLNNAYNDDIDKRFIFLALKQA